MLQTYARMPSAEVRTLIGTDIPLDMLLVHFRFVQYVQNNVACMRDLYRLVSLSRLHLEVRMRRSDVIVLVRQPCCKSVKVLPTCEICGASRQSEFERIAFLSQGCHRQQLNEAGLRGMNPASP
jgi:hypothetical protein